MNGDPRSLQCLYDGAVMLYVQIGVSECMTFGWESRADCVSTRHPLLADIGLDLALKNSQINGVIAVTVSDRHGDRMDGDG